MLTVAVISTFLSLKSNWYMTLAAIWTVLYVAIFASIVAGLIQLKYQKVVGSNTAALIYTVQPVFALILSYFLLGEKLGLSQSFGALLLLTAMLIASLKRTS
ncbi:MAG: hypothetical protein PWQ48_1860 [Thermotogaceae bacterium]|jgi:drug/metabolite transporter (DMT)-like permease|nr:hypothetical protein [Thermotogaceae bacterium]